MLLFFIIMMLPLSVSASENIFNNIFPGQPSQQQDRKEQGKEVDQQDFKSFAPPAAAQFGRPKKVTHPKK